MTELLLEVVHELAPDHRIRARRDGAADMLGDGADVVVVLEQPAVHQRIGRPFTHLLPQPVPVDGGLPRRYELLEIEA